MQGDSTFDEYDRFHLAEDLLDLAERLLNLGHELVPDFGTFAFEDKDFCAFIDEHPELRELADLDFDSET